MTEISTVDWEHQLAEAPSRFGCACRTIRMINGPANSLKKQRKDCACCQPAYIEKPKHPLRSSSAHSMMLQKKK
eukprot:861390-Pelagomonas_calceolata.AAC.4